MDNMESEYVLDKLVDGIEDHTVAQEELDNADDEELVGLVYSMHDDLLDLTRDEFVVYNAARSELFDRGYGYQGDAGLTIVDPEGNEV